jgi:hypothetical protein
MTGYITKAWDAGKETIYATAAGAGFGAIAYGTGKYATALVNGIKFVNLTKALPYTDGMSKGVATLGNVYNAVSIVAVGAFATKVFEYAATTASKYVVSKTGLNNVDNWYAKKAGHFVVWTLATTATVASTAYFANAVLGLAFTKTLLGASGAATGFDALLKGKTVVVDSFSWAKAGTALYFANRTLANAEYNEEQANIQLNGTREADIIKLKESIQSLLTLAEDDETDRVLKDDATEQEKAKYEEVQNQIKALGDSKEPKVIGLKGQLIEAKKLDQSVQANKDLVIKLTADIAKIELLINGEEEVTGTDGKGGKAAVKSLAEKKEEALTAQTTAQEAYEKTWTSSVNHEICE